jgi:hypothetical protein
MIVKLKFLKFQSVIDLAIEGRPKYLAAYLRSNDPLNEGERELLACFVERAMDRKKGRPIKSVTERVQVSSFARPIDIAAMDFKRILKVWQIRYGKKYGVRDKAVAVAAKRRGVSFESLDNLLRRAKST